jgi:hypothetical protein
MDCCLSIKLEPQQLGFNANQFVNFSPLLLLHVLVFASLRASRENEKILAAAKNNGLFVPM